MSTREWSVHEVANCTECKWESESRNAKQLAKRHAERTGHCVIGERGLAFEFGALRVGEPPREREI